MSLSIHNTYLNIRSQTEFVPLDLNIPSLNLDTVATIKTVIITLAISSYYDPRFSLNSLRLNAYEPCHLYLCNTTTFITGCLIRFKYCTG